MRRRYLIGGLALACSLWITYGRVTSDEINDLDPVPQSIVAGLLDGRIERIDVYFLPYDVLTSVQVTPEQLEVSATKKFSVKLTPSSAKSWADTVEKIRLTDLSSPLDLRWGIVFLDRSGSRMHSIYLNSRYITGTGRKGYLDGKLYGFNASLINWLEANYLN